MTRSDFTDTVLDTIEWLWPWVVVVLTLCAVGLILSFTWMSFVGVLIGAYCAYYWYQAYKQRSFRYSRKPRGDAE